MNIEFKEGAVCFADNRQWSFNDSVKPYKLVSNMHGTRLEGYSDVVDMPDFQLNTIKQGDCIGASELDTEDKYNRAIEVFGLFGFELCNNVNDFNWFNSNRVYEVANLVATESKLMGVRAEYSSIECKRKTTFSQLMAIGELKRLMDERESINRQSEYCRCIQAEVGSHSAKPSNSVSKVNRDIERNQPKNKSKQAYAILESLDYDYDLVKQKWFRKEWV